MPFLDIERLTKRFGDLVVLDDLSLRVEEGEVLALLGPSGSGKTTFLRLLAGFEVADGGSIRAAGRDVTRLAPAARGFGMVFQHYALFPHLTVRGNVAFGLEARSAREGWTKEAIGDRVEEVLALVDLEGFGDRPVGALSGGQQQRVALARALAPDPPLLLLDEPLSNLDPSLRERTRRELLAAIRRVGITTVLVTHEQEEAFHLGDRVAVLWRGALQQAGTPEELYLEPANRFVASFIGRSTALPGTLVERTGADGRGATVALDAGATWEGRLPDPAQSPEAVPAEAGPEAGDRAVLVVRPEGLTLTGDGAESPVRGDESLAGVVVGRRYGGPVTYYQVEVDGLEVEVLAPSSAAAEGDRVRIAPRRGGSGPSGTEEVPVPSIHPEDAPGPAAGAIGPGRASSGKAAP